MDMRDARPMTESERKRLLRLLFGKRTETQPK
jgi:hypothetical protein